MKYSTLLQNLQPSRPARMCRILYRIIHLLLLISVVGCASSNPPAPPKYGCEGQLLTKFDRMPGSVDRFLDYAKAVSPKKAVIITEHMEPQRGGERMTIAIKRAFHNLDMTVAESTSMPSTPDGDVLYVHPLCLRKTDNDFELQFMTVTRFSLNRESVVYDLVGIGRYKPSMVETLGGLTATVVMPVAALGQASAYRTTYGERAAFALQKSYEDFWKGNRVLAPELPVTSCIEGL